MINRIYAECARKCANRDFTVDLEWRFKTKTKWDQIQFSADPTNSEPRKYFGALNRLGSVSSPPEATFRRIRYGTSLVPGDRGLDQSVPGQFKPSVTGCTMPWPMGILFARGCAEIPHAWTPREEDTMFPPLSFFYVAGGSVIRGRSPTSKGSSLNRSEWEFTSTGAAPWHHGCW